MHIYGGPITRAGAKKIQVALNGLIKKIWIENAIQDARHNELGLERGQSFVGIIQVVGQLNAQFGLNAKKGNFRIKLVLIELELMCKLYTIGKIIKLTFQCNLQS